MFTHSYRKYKETQIISRGLVIPNTGLTAYSFLVSSLSSLSISFSSRRTCSRAPSPSSASRRVPDVIHLLGMSRRPDSEIPASRRFDKYKTIHRRLRLQVQKIPGSTTTGLRLHPHHRATLSLTWLSTSSLAEPMQPPFLPPSPPALLLTLPHTSEHKT